MYCKRLGEENMLIYTLEQANLLEHDKLMYRYVTVTAWQRESVRQCRVATLPSLHINQQDVLLWSNLTLTRSEIQCLLVDYPGYIYDLSKCSSLILPDKQRCLLCQRYAWLFSNVWLLALPPQRAHTVLLTQWQCQSHLAHILRSLFLENN